MNIIFDAEDFKNRPRGIVKSTICLYRACKNQNADLRFIGLARKPVQTGLPDFLDFVMPRPDINRTVWRFLMHNVYLATHDFSVIHYPSNGMIPPIIFSKNVVLTLYDIVQLTIPQYFSDRSKEQRFRNRRQADLNRAALIFTASEYSKKEILKHFSTPVEPVVLPCAPILEPLATDRPGVSMEVNRREEYFLFNATYDPRKGLPTLIEVYFSLWKTGRIKTRLDVTGDPFYYSPDFKRLMEEAVAAGAVSELGYLSDDEMTLRIQGAKGLIYPSKYEGFGLPPADAMNLGCPVITTRGTSLPEVCGDAAIYVDPDDHEDFSRAIMALDGNEMLRKELVEKGRKQVQRFSWSRSAAIFLEHVSQLCKKDKPGA